MKPKKLIRKLITEKLKEGEWETITDQDELNKLYEIKFREELAEIQESEHKDIMEFVDLIQVAFSYAKVNGFTHEQLSLALVTKSIEKGTFGRLALNNLNPKNPSNKLYFQTKSDCVKEVGRSCINCENPYPHRYVDGSFSCEECGHEWKV